MACVFVWVCDCVTVFAYVRMCECAYVRMSVCANVCVRARECVHVRVCVWGVCEMCVCGEYVRCECVCACVCLFMLERRTRMCVHVMCNECYSPSESKTVVVVLRCCWCCCCCCGVSSVAGPFPLSRLLVR